MRDVDLYAGRYAKWKYLRARHYERLAARLFWHLAAGKSVKEHTSWGFVWGVDATYMDGAPIQYHRDPWRMAQHLMARHTGFGWRLELIAA